MGVEEVQRWKAERKILSCYCHAATGAKGEGKLDLRQGSAKIAGREFLLRGREFLLRLSGGLQGELRHHLQLLG